MTERNRADAFNTPEDMKLFLEQQDKSTLVQWIMDWVKRDENWWQQLQLKVASQCSHGIDLTTFRRTLSEVITVEYLIEWNEVSSYAENISSVLRSIRDLLADHPQAVIELCEYAVPLLEIAVNEVDDSNGDVGDILEEFQELHHQACERAQPDPIALAERLFHAELDSEFDSFSNAVEIYADILGDEGRAHYRALAESLWQEYPDLTSRDGGWDYRRRKLQRLLEDLARDSGDLEDIVAIKRRDLSQPGNYLDIAKLYLQDGQRDRALEWAESGLEAFDRPDNRLRDFVFDEYLIQGRVDEAMELAWQSFTQSVGLTSYQKLKAQAEQVDRWTSWRDKALAHIRQQLERQKQPPPPVKTSKTRRGRRAVPERGTRTYIAPTPVSSLGDHSLLVEIFLWEGEDELAWKEAQEGDCTQRLWLELADRRQQDHPADALPIYQQPIEPLIRQTNNTAYATAVSFLDKVHDLMFRLDQQEEFWAYVAHLRQTYKAKRNFMALLKQRNW